MGMRMTLSLVGERLDDRLPDPPGAVGREAAALGVIEPFHRLDESDVSFVDQVEEREAAVLILLCDGNDEPEIAVDHPVLLVPEPVLHLEQFPGLFGIGLLPDRHDFGTQVLYLLSDLLLFVHRKQRVHGNLLEIQGQGIGFLVGSHRTRFPLHLFHGPFTFYHRMLRSNGSLIFHDFLDYMSFVKEFKR